MVLLRRGGGGYTPAKPIYTGCLVYAFVTGGRYLWWGALSVFAGGVGVPRSGRRWLWVGEGSWGGWSMLKLTPRRQCETTAIKCCHFPALSVSLQYNVRETEGTPHPLQRWEGGNCSATPCLWVCWYACERSCHQSRRERRRHSPVATGDALQSLLLASCPLPMNGGTVNPELCSFSGLLVCF